MTNLLKMTIRIEYGLSLPIEAFLSILLRISIISLTSGGTLICSYMITIYKQRRWTGIRHIIPVRFLTEDGFEDVHIFAGQDLTPTQQIRQSMKYVDNNGIEHFVKRDSERR